MKNIISMLVLTIYATTIKAAFVEKVEVKTGPTNIKVVILSGSLEYKNLTLHNPERIVIDLQDAFSKIKPKTDVNNSPVMSIRASQYKYAPVPVTRIVIDLDKPAECSFNQIEKGIEISFATNSPAPVTQEEPKPAEEAKPAEATKPAEEKSAEGTAPATTPQPSATASEQEETVVETPAPVSVVDTLGTSEPDTSYISTLFADSLAIEKQPISQDTIRKDTIMPLKEPFFYNSRGKRDPFRPWLGIESGPNDSLLDISASTIVGIMWSPKERYALAQDNSGKGYVLCEGDKVWNGKVERIEKDNVVFALHGFGGIKKITLKLLPKEVKK